MKAYILVLNYLINMKTTESQIEAKIQEIREGAKYPYTYFKNREDLSDLEWMTKELKNTQLIYKIVAIPTAIFCVFLIVHTIGMGLEIFENRNIEPLNLSLLVIGLLSFIMHSYQYKIKIEKLKSGLFLFELKESLKEAV